MDSYRIPKASKRVEANSGVAMRMTLASAREWPTKIHTTVPTDALVYDSALHFVCWAMEDPEAHCLQFRFVMAGFGNNNCDADATKGGCSKEVL